MNDSRPWQFPDARIIVFARKPLPGQVKTRLAAEIGDKQAALAYTLWFEQSVETICQAAIAPVELWVSPDTDHALFDCLANNYPLSLHVQPGGDLGQRMQEVLAQVLSRHPRAVLIGSDCPVMPPDYISRAFLALASGIDTVLGPVEDGGYVLVGMNRLQPTIFNGIPWSTPVVMRATRQRLIKAKQDWAELETLWDIDTHQDYQRWLSMNDALEGHKRAGRPSCSSGSAC